MQTSSERNEIHNVAVFDFDGTIVDGQSGALFTTYLFRNHMMSLGRALRLGWWGVRYKLHLPYRQDEARELVFGALLGRPYDEVDALMGRFHDEVLLPRYRPQAVDEVARRNAEGNVTLLVSATFETIAQAAARTLGMDGVVATQMAHDAQGAYLGLVEGPVIAGAEKYRAVVRWCDERLGVGQWLLAYAYGDHHTDKDLLSHAREPFAVCPGKTLHAIAKQHGWKILDWDA